MKQDAAPEVRAGLLATIDKIINVPEGKEQEEKEEKQEITPSLEIAVTIARTDFVQLNLPNSTLKLRGPTTGLVRQFIILAEICHYALILIRTQVEDVDQVKKWGCPGTSGNPTFLLE